MTPALRGSVYHQRVCGRFLLTTPGEALVELLGLSEAPQLTPRGNIAPTEPVGLVRARAQGLGREWAMARWGLVPHWVREPLKGAPLFNARAESVEHKPAFRDAFRERRCLIPADGFYEWTTEGRRKRPFLISLPDRQPFAFAGLWERWRRGDDPALESCTIITTTPHAALRELHDRMPVILDPAEYATWLDPRATPDVLRGMLRPYWGELVVGAAGALPAV